MRACNTYGAIVVLLAALAFGCASTPKEQVLFWPDFPDEPKIAYVRQYQLDADFRKRTFWDNVFGVSPEPLLVKPQSVFALGSKLYITDSQMAAVVVYDTAEMRVRFLRGDKENFQTPIGVAATPQGAVFVSDAKRGKVYGFDPDGRQVTVIGNKERLKTPAGIALNQELGRLYVVEAHGHRVLVYNLLGEPLFEFGRQGAGDGELSNPTHIAVDHKTGKVYVVDTFNFRVQVFDKDGKFLLKFGEIGDTPGSFTRPKGIGVDTEGHVYVVDAAFDNFQIFDAEGRILMFVGSGGIEPGRFSVPAGLYVDERDRIYAVDSVNRRVQVFQYLSAQWIKEHPEEYQKLKQPKAPGERK